jgi:Sec-independent protein secretion pathway component TatC
MKCKHWRKFMAAMFSAGMLFQLPGGCNIGEITTVTTTTLNGRDVIISLVRSAIITPLDAVLTNWITNAVENLTTDE